MDIIADIFLGAGALGAGLYCMVLARRLNRFGNLEKGVGGAVSVLSAQVDELSKTLENAQLVSENSKNSLDQITDRAEKMASRLELLMASMHDISDFETGKNSNDSTSSLSTEPVEPLFIRRKSPKKVV